MTDIGKEILERWQVRKTKKQKMAFEEFLRGHFPELTLEQAGPFKSRNLVLGDVKTAKTILTAHYDTCARLPFPNFLTPENILLYILYQLLIIIPFLLIMVAVNVALRFLLPEAEWGLFAGYLTMMAALFFVLMGGPANRHTANDNTSGVIALVELYAAMTEAQRQETALVFFDHEESGLLGSAAFARKHKKENLKEKLVLNFDCVSDGDEFLLVLNKGAREKFQSALAAAFQPVGEKTFRLTTSGKAMYPSDQANFPTSAAVAAFRRFKWAGLYMSRIHTKRDTVFDERNIDALKAGTLAFLETI